MNLNNQLSIQLPQFEGPLGLLLFLIRKEEMDILNIPIQKITNQYLEYIKLMKELDLEMAGEFVAMAATLLQIKSRMLLPQYDENGEIIENDDPRKELVQRLMEYQKYQEASKSLYERALLGRDTWARGIREKLELPEENILIEENGLFSLISAYRGILKTAKKKVHEVAQKLQSIASRILEIKDRLIIGQKVAMSTLLNATQDRHKQLLITFLSTLELGKMGFVSLFQTESFSEIWIEAKKPIEADAVSSVEEYDNINSESLAMNLINKANRQESVQEEEIMDLTAPIEMQAIQQNADNDDDFVLNDSDEFDQEMNGESIAVESYEGIPLDMASDEDIENAEKDLEV
jgi:segregation and condensation protein A